MAALGPQRIPQEEYEIMRLTQAGNHSVVALSWSMVATYSGVPSGKLQSMDAVGRLFALQTLHLRWLTTTGIAFQDLFADLMQNAWPQDFQKVKPYGRTGDMKCDGYWKSRRCVFQCYGPASMKEREVIAKIRRDLDGAVVHWQGRIAEWAFVHNDKEGLSPNVVQVLDDLRLAYPRIKIAEWAWPQAREQFERLSDKAIVELYGHPPTAKLVDQLGFAELRPVVEQIAKASAAPLAELSSPPSVRKLEKNLLDQASADFLQIGRRQVRLVEDYFAQHHDPRLGDQIAAAMHAHYRMLVDTGEDPNKVLVLLQRFAGWDCGETNSHNAAVLAVVTYFFDRCDIFEDPDDESSVLGT